MAQQTGDTCDTRENMLRILSEQYAETPVAVGLRPNGTVLELVVSAHGSWTVLITAPTGLSCALTAGEAWQALSPQLANDPGA